MAKDIAGWVWSYEDEDGIHFTSADITADDLGQTVFRTDVAAKLDAERHEADVGDGIKWKKVHGIQWTSKYYAVYPIYMRD